MKRKSKKFNFKKLFFWLLLVVNSVFAFLLLLSFFAQYSKPSFSVFIAYCGMGFPYLLVINLVLFVLWLFINYRFSLISISIILLNINNIDRHFQLKDSPKPPKCLNCIKVMSYNVKLFDLYTNSNDKKAVGKEAIFDFLKKEQPDIVCFQEYFYDQSNKLNFHTTDSILSILNLENSKEYYYQYFPVNLRNQYYYGVATFSRYRIIRAEVVPMPEFSTNTAIFIDIKYKSDTIRIYNAHLASMHMDKEDYEAGKQLMSNNIEDPHFNLKAKSIYKKVGEAFKKRQEQALAIRAHIDSCRYAVIICGDFNDTPASYSYNKIASGFKDSFRESGEGRGFSYNGEAFPSYRIDYILHSKKYNSYGYKVCRELSVSDHFPIYTYISLQRKTP